VNEGLAMAVSPGLQPWWCVRAPEQSTLWWAISFKVHVYHCSDVPLLLHLQTKEVKD